MQQERPQPLVLDSSNAEKAQSRTNDRLDEVGLQLAPSPRLSPYSPVDNRVRAWSYSGGTASLSTHQSLTQRMPHLELMSPKTVIPDARVSPRNAQIEGDFKTESSKGLRSRALSETGRMLLFGFINSQEDLPWQTELKEKQAKERASARAANRVRKKAEKKKARQASSQRVNYFALIGSDDEEDTQDAFKHLVSRNSATSIEVPKDPPAMQPLVARIEEAILGEEEGEGDDWETVPKKSTGKKKKKKKVEEKKPASPRQDLPWNSDEDDLWDLQQSTFGGRQVGSGKKSMQFKATEKRNYAIDKRQRQRGGR